MWVCCFSAHHPNTGQQALPQFCGLSITLAEEIVICSGEIRGARCSACPPCPPHTHRRNTTTNGTLASPSGNRTRPRSYPHPRWANGAVPSPRATGPKVEHARGQPCTCTSGGAESRARRRASTEGSPGGEGERVLGGGGGAGNGSAAERGSTGGRGAVPRGGRAAPGPHRHSVAHPPARSLGDLGVEVADPEAVPVLQGALGQDGGILQRQRLSFRLHGGAGPPLTIPGLAQASPRPRRPLMTSQSGRGLMTTARRDGEQRCEHPPSCSATPGSRTGPARPGPARLGSAPLGPRCAAAHRGTTARQTGRCGAPCGAGRPREKGPGGAERRGRGL